MDWPNGSRGQICANDEKWKFAFGLKQYSTKLRVSYVTQGYFECSSSFMLFNLVGCGGGKNRFKSRWEEFLWKISTAHAHIYHNQRIFLRLKNQLFLSLFPSANLTYAWCRFGVNNILDYNEVIAVWSFSLAVWIKWIPYSMSNTIYRSHSPCFVFPVTKELVLYKRFLTEAYPSAHYEMRLFFFSFHLIYSLSSW